MEEKVNLAAPIPMKSEARALRPIPVSLKVRWREFRIQLLPLVAFGGSLVLAGLLWEKSVLPVPVEFQADPPSGMTQTLDPDPPMVASPSLHQVSQAGTNGVFKIPAARE